MTTYAYTRVSTTEQAADDRSSLDDQERRCRGAALMRGDEVAEVYDDPGVSGSIPLGERPGGGRLLAGLKPGDVVIAAKLDRIFRSALDALATVETFRARGVRLVLADMGPEPVTENGASKLFFSMLAAFAEFERARIAERMADGRRGKAARGGHIGGDAPYGFRVEGEGRSARLVPVPEEQETIEVAVEWRQAGWSLRRIAAALARNGHRPRSGKTWSPETVRRLTME